MTLENSQAIRASELIINPDGSIYHLHLRPEQLADTIFTVGDPDRVDMVSKYFDEVEFKIRKREFATHTGRIGNKQVTVISTGIGTDNIDICFNELDALANIDFETRQVKTELKQLDIIRLGTSGCLLPNIPVDSLLASAYAVGMEGLMLYYDFENTADANALKEELAAFATAHNLTFPIPFTTAQASNKLLDLYAPASSEIHRGITITATGFYAPQNRQLRVKSNVAGSIIDKLGDFAFKEHKISNLEMETSGIYGLSTALGHNALSLNALVANRANGIFSTDPYQIVDKLIKETLERFANS